jgi:hypothetical protein
MNSTVPPAPVRMPLALPVGCWMPFGNGLVSVQVVHGVRPPSVLAT